VLFGAINKDQSASAPAVWQNELYWLLVVAVGLLATHVARMQSAETWLGLISPFVATVGDVFMAISGNTSHIAGAPVVAAHDAANREKSLEAPVGRAGRGYGRSAAAPRSRVDERLIFLLRLTAKRGHRYRQPQD